MQRIILVLGLLWWGVNGISAQEETSAGDCIVIMGDSLPAGTFVAEFPGTGVAVLQSERISNVLDDALQAKRLLHYGIYDLSLGASAIAAPDSEPYLTSREFVLGRNLNCRYVVIFPFLNDLYRSNDGETGIAIYQQGLRTMLDFIRSYSPDSQIILMHFYAVTLQGVGELTYEGDVSAAHVDAMNDVHDDACADDATISCLALDEILHPIEDYVLSRITRDEYEAIYSVVNPDDEDMANRYWTNTPNNPIRGDGLHLNPDGQARLVMALMGLFEQIDPDNFAPIIP